MQPISTVLHPTDLSEASRPALRIAGRLAREQNARLLILNVLSAAALYSDMGMAVPLPEIEDSLLEAQHGVLEDWAAELKTAISTDCRVVEGAPAEEILRIAAEAPGTLVVLGTHGRSSLGRVLLGSVADTVVRRAPCPVLTIRPHARIPSEGPLFPSILHPTDFSVSALRALDVAAELARGQSAGPTNVMVLHVVEAVHIGSEDYQSMLRERLQAIRPTVPHPTLTFDYQIAEGDPAAETLSLAERSATALIAIGTHGRTGIDRLVTGSVALAILHRAHCPVLTVRAAN